MQLPQINMALHARVNIVIWNERFKRRLPQLVTLNKESDKLLTFYSLFFNFEVNEERNEACIAIDTHTTVAKRKSAPTLPAQTFISHITCLLTCRNFV